MNATCYTILGVMSGTSLDGVDFAYIKFTKKESWEYELLDCKTVAYEDNWVIRLREAVNTSNEELAQLDEDYTYYLSTLINKFIVNVVNVGIS